jgi:hypothetical protein
VSRDRRKFRPYDIPVGISRFFDDAELVIGNDETIFVAAGNRRVVSDHELRSGSFSLSLARDDAAFEELVQRAIEAAGDTVDSVGLAVVATSAYLKLADVLVDRPLREIDRITPLTDGAAARSFHAVVHGCDVEAGLVLRNDLDDAPLRPWRKATWLSRARFELRTGLDGAGFNVLPLDDERRAELHLPKKTLRYVALEESPLELAAAAAVNLYVDSDLLARLNREMSKGWAVAFSDQLAVDVLSAIANRALVDTNIDEADWTQIEESLLGAVIAMVDGNAGGSESEVTRRRQDLLDTLRSHPTRFLALIEGAVEMRDNVKRIVGG